MTFIVGLDKDPLNKPTYRKIMESAATIIFVVLTSLLLLNIVLYRITII